MTDDSRAVLMSALRVMYAEAAHVGATTTDEDVADVAVLAAQYFDARASYSGSLARVLAAVDEIEAAAGRGAAIQLEAVRAENWIEGLQMMEFAVLHRTKNTGREWISLPYALRAEAEGYACALRLDDSVVPDSVRIVATVPLPAAPTERSPDA